MTTMEKHVAVSLVMVWMLSTTAAGMLAESKLDLDLELFGKVDVPPVLSIDDFILNILQCNPDSVAFISDDNPYVDIISNYLTKHYNVFSHLNFRDFPSRENYLMQWLEEIYTVYPETVFFVMLANPAPFMEIIDKIARMKGQGQLFLIRHKTQWLIFHWSDEQLRFVVPEESLVLDNVVTAHLFIDMAAKSPDVTVNQMQTLMWRMNRTREWETLFVGSLERCGLFPNKRLGLNGRTLYIVAKPYLTSMLYVKKNENTNIPEYQGQLIELLEVFANTLNFTHDIWPPPAWRQFPTWADYLKTIENGTFDIGLNTWPIAYSNLYPLATTYPFLFDHITGLYQIPEKSEKDSSKNLLFPFPRVIYLYFVLILLITTVVYTITLLPDPTSDVYKGRQYETKKKAIFKHFLFILCKLGASIINQIDLPSPRHVSSRIILGCWAITLVLLYAVYTGFITARMIKPDTPLPFNTFQELATREDFKWGTAKGSVINDIIGKSQGSIIETLAQRSKTINVDDSWTANEIIDAITSRSKDNFVLIYFESSIKEWLRLHQEHGRYTMMKNALLEAHSGFLLTEKSEVENLLSNIILRLHETGLLPRQESKNLESADNPHKMQFNKAQQRSLGVVDFHWTFICSFFLLSLACLALVTEIAVTRCRRIEGKRMTKVSTKKIYETTMSYCNASKKR